MTPYRIAFYIACYAAGSLIAAKKAQDQGMTGMAIFWKVSSIVGFIVAAAFAVIGLLHLSSAD